MSKPKTPDFIPARRDSNGVVLVPEDHERRIRSLERKAIRDAGNELLVQLRAVLVTHRHEHGCCDHAQRLVDSLPMPE